MLMSSEILFSITSPSFVALNLLVSEIANVLSEVVYCLLLIYKNYRIVYILISVLLVSIASQCFTALHLLVSDVLPEAICCCFTRITLFTKLFFSC